jgi:hypothetical protein
VGETARAPITTILFTDLVDSTTLMQRVGDERAQRLFETHHQLLSDAISAHGGSELQWLGEAPDAAPWAAELGVSPGLVLGLRSEPWQPSRSTASLPSRRHLPKSCGSGAADGRR